MTVTNPIFAIPTGNAAQIPGIVGDDTLGNAETLGSLTATIDDTSAAYIAAINNNGLWIVDKQTLAAGATKTVNVTLAGTDVKGNPLTGVIQPFGLSGPPLPPLATHIVSGAITTQSKLGLVIPDPGTPTVKLI